jgi:NadR type nicotinamide-nucleotide adenylyltransferase
MATVEFNSEGVIILNGILFGKFFPPHLGHLHCIDFAAQQCSKLFVVVCSSANASPGGSERAKWIQQMAPRAEVLLTEDLCDWHFGSSCIAECSNTWAQWLSETITERIDIVFSSEEYGPRFASLINSEHVFIDLSRDFFAISGTQVRLGLSDHWLDLPEVVRAGLFRKIVILGSESSGTSTLASDLALALDAPLIAEVGRTISWELSIRHKGMENVDWDEKVFWRVLREQSDAETSARFQGCNKVPRDYGPWIVCDTDAVATVVWWSRYLQSSPSAAWSFAQTGLADIYVVTDPSDVEFYQDGIRDGEHLRHEMHEAFIEIVERAQRLFVIAKGSREERVARVIDAIKGYESTVPRFIPSIDPI